MAVVSLRIDLGEERRFGPGKARLLELIRDTGSISAAGRALGMSYRRAWLLVDDMNRSFRAAVVVTKGGGAKGGGAALTAFGRALIEKYRAIEAQATAATRPQVDALAGELRGRRRGTRKPVKTSIRPAAR